VHLDAEAAAVDLLARRWTRYTVRDGTPAFFVALPRASRACRASGTTIAGLFILARMVAVSMFALLLGSWGSL